MSLDFVFELYYQFDFLIYPVKLCLVIFLFFSKILKKKKKVFCEVTSLFYRRPGGSRIYGVFDHQLPAALKKLPLDRHLSQNNVRKVISEADGYQPHLIAPEQGYRRLIDGSLGYFKGPAEASVDAVNPLVLNYV